MAPFHVHLLSLDAGNPEVAAAAERAERDLESAGFEVLHDDREGLSPGVKFKDADLLGMPLRVVVGAKGLKDGTIELKDRQTKKMQKVPFEQLVAAAREFARSSSQAPATVSEPASAPHGAV